MAKTYIQGDLKVPKLEGVVIQELTIREVIQAYRKAVKKVHPDISGYDSKEYFQEIGGAYEKILKIFSSHAHVFLHCLHPVRSLIFMDFLKLYYYLMSFILIYNCNIIPIFFIY